MDAESRLTANAAHELRTPAAAALAQTQRLLFETSDPKAGKKTAETETSFKRLARLSEKLMHLARAEGGRLRRETASDIRPVLESLLSVVTRIAESESLKATLAEDPALSDIEPDTFAIPKPSRPRTIILIGMFPLGFSRYILRAMQWSVLKSSRR